MPRTLSALDGALLGLLARGPATGYDLRRVFQTTALGRFSDSPGSIYPALRRLEAQKLVAGSSEAGGRRRRVLRLTAAGTRAVIAWVTAPVTADDLLRDPALVDLRLAFISDVAPERLTRFLQEYAEAAAEYQATLELARGALEEGTPESGVLAFTAGLTLARARARWSRDAAAARGSE